MAKKKAAKKKTPAKKKQRYKTPSEGLPLIRRTGPPPASEITPRNQFFSNRNARTIRDPKGGKKWLKENPFWTKRSPEGVQAIFADPEMLWQCACSYFELCIENPWYHNEAKVVDGEVVLVQVPHAIPFTLKGLCLYLGTVDTYWKMFKVQKFVKASPKFISVIDQIEAIIYTQKFTGAAVGAFKENLIARDLGLTDNVNVNMSEQKAKETAQLFPLVHPDDWKDADVVDGDGKNQNEDEKI